jgi:hypothetical protein
VKCPKCKSSEVYRSHRRGVVEKVVLRVMSKAPYQCKSCKHRFVREVQKHHHAADRARRKNRMVFVAGLIIALFAAMLVVEWGNRPPSSGGGGADSGAP